MHQPTQKIHLICMPFSGGSSFAFQSLAAYWPSSIEVTTLSYPGRGPRIREPLLYTMNDMLDDIWDQVKGLTGQTFAMFGHSMGATLAFLAAHRILKEGCPPPLHLFLSGTDGPRAPKEHPPRYLLPKKMFMSKLESYGGISEEILKDQEAFNFFEPILRADFQVIETWTYSDIPPLDIPATVITGTEESMSEEDIRLWQKEFITEVEFEKMKGHHFFLLDRPREFVHLISKKISGSSSANRRKIKELINDRTG